MIKGIEEIQTAKQFLLQRIIEQAMEESVPFSSKEQQMLLFSEDSATEEEMRLAQQFDSDADDSGYEAKVESLFRHAYTQDKHDAELAQR